jgi:glycosyltransferase involved in cell wall biosynthesis
LLGRLVPEKGIDVALRACVRVRSDLPHVKVALAGDGPERGALTALIDELHGISDAWLAEKSAGEKGFSVGYFDAAYLAQFPAAIVRPTGARSGWPERRRSTPRSGP